MFQRTGFSDHGVRGVDDSNPGANLCDFDALDSGTLDRKLAIEAEKRRPQERYFREAVPEYKTLLGGVHNTVSNVYLERALNRWTSRWPLRTLRNFTGEDVSSYLEDLVERGHTEVEIRRERNLFQSFFRWAIRSGWADGNPTADLKRLLHAPTTRSVSWSSSEQQKLLEACRRRWNTPGQGLLLPPKYLYPLTLLGLRSGLQLASLLNLEWRHVDLVGSRLVIPATEIHAAGAIKIPLSIDAFQLLKELRDKVDAMIRAPQKVLAVLRPPVRGKRFDSRQALIDFRYARKRAGVPEGDFYSLRLSFARNCAEGGVPIKAAARMVDWEDLGELMDIYRNFAPAPAGE